MDQIQAMRIFVRVVEAGTFTRAADSLALPKGTVTKQIQALESRLRVKLLNRTTRRVTVTPDGAAYFERAARLLNDFDDMEASMTNAQSSPTGRLRIDVGTSVARLVILPALATFCDRYPEIQVDLGVSDRTVDLISDNVDCVIRAGDLADQSLVARRIGNESNAHMAAVLGGFGISQCITFMAEPHLESGELIEVLSDWHRDPLPIHVVYPPNRHLSAKVRAFVDWAAELFAKTPRLQRR